jgi:rubrerythrin
MLVDRQKKELKEKKGWTMADVPWELFDARKVDKETLKIIKAASLVEYNAHDYAAYLQNVFEGDEMFQDDLKKWAEEEVQHGMALGRWAEMADPTFNFQQSFKRFIKGFRINTAAKESIRGSRAGELVARCIVETGTSNYYTAVAEGAEEPVLKYICRQIAGDEYRHYKLFYDNLNFYLDKENLGKLDRLRIGLGRIAESEDDELAYAYYAANTKPRAANDNKGIYDRKVFSNAYAARAFGCYRPRHIDKMVNMVFKACGLNTQGWLAKIVSHFAFMGVQAKLRKAIEFDRTAV